MAKKLFVAVLAAILAFGVTIVAATESRIECLGSQGLYLMDDTDIFANPAAATYYPKMIRLHFAGIDGNDEDQPDTWAYGGGTMTVMDMLTFGVFVARNPGYEAGGIGSVTDDALPGTGAYGPIEGLIFYDYFNLGGGGYPFPPNIVPTWKNPVDAVFAVRLGSLVMGISYYLANGRFDYEDKVPDSTTPPPNDSGDSITYKGKARLQSFKAGACYKIGAWLPELWIHLNHFIIESTFRFDDDGDGDYTSTQQLEGLKFVVGSRLFYYTSGAMTIVPAFRWETVAAQVGIDASGDIWLGPGTNEGNLEQSYRYNAIIGGIGAQYRAGNIFIITSAALKWTRFERELAIETPNYNYWKNVATDKSFTVPEVALGLEFQTTRWLCLRGGIHTTAIWASHTASERDTREGGVSWDEDVDWEMIETNQVTTASIGVGLVFGNFVIDATLGNAVLANEEGDNSVGPNIFSNLDIKYEF